MTKTPVGGLDGGTELVQSRVAKDGQRPIPNSRDALPNAKGNHPVAAGHGNRFFDKDDVKRSHYSARVALADYHLHALEADARSSMLHMFALPIAEVEGLDTMPETATPPEGAPSTRRG